MFYKVFVYTALAYLEDSVKTVCLSSQVSTLGGREIFNRHSFNLSLVFADVFFKLYRKQSACIESVADAVFFFVACFTEGFA